MLRDQCLPSSDCGDDEILSWGQREPWRIVSRRICEQTSGARISLASVPMLRLGRRVKLRLQESVASGTMSQVELQGS